MKIRLNKGIVNFLDLCDYYVHSRFYSRFGVSTMASVWRRDDSKYWVACFTCADGRQLKRSTKTTDRKKALKIAVELEQAALHKKTRKQLWTVLTDLQSMFTDESIKQISLQAFSKTWLKSKRLSTSETTFQSYDKSCRKFTEYLADRALEPINELEKPDISGFRDHVGHQLSATTANHDLKIVRMMLEDAKRDGYIPDNPADGVSTLKKTQSNKKRRAFTMDELKRVMKVASGEWYGLIMFGLYTGQRLKDLVMLTWQNLDLEDRVIILETSKTGRVQRIPIASPLLDFIATIEAGESSAARLFPQSYSTYKRRLVNSTATLSNQFYDLMVEAGIVKERSHKATGKGRHAPRAVSEISFHALRHTATSLLKKAGVSAGAISNQYTHIDDEAKAMALSKLPDLG